MDAVPAVALSRSECKGDSTNDISLLCILYDGSLVFWSACFFTRFSLQDGCATDTSWRRLAPESPMPNNDAKVFYFKTGPVKKVTFCFDFRCLTNRPACSLLYVVFLSPPPPSPPLPSPPSSFSMQESSVRQSPYVVVDQVIRV